MERKKLYCLPELHPTLEEKNFYILLDFFLVKRIKENSENNKEIKRIYEEFERGSERRVEKLSEIIRGYKPKIIFSEGYSLYFRYEISQAFKIAKIKRPVKVIILSSYSLADKLLDSEYDKCLDYANNIDKKIECMKILSSLLKRYNLVREKEYAETIQKYFEYPSLLIIGASHLLQNMNASQKLEYFFKYLNPLYRFSHLKALYGKKFLPYYFLDFGGINSFLTLFMETEYLGKVGYLGEYLKRRGIEPKIVGYFCFDIMIYKIFVFKFHLKYLDFIMPG